MENEQKEWKTFKSLIGYEKETNDEKKIKDLGRRQADLMEINRLEKEKAKSQRNSAVQPWR